KGMNHMVIATHASGILPYSLFYIRPAHIMPRHVTYICPYVCMHMYLYAALHLGCGRLQR
ncbi:hypothetical protein F4813DRAFT_345012, partial [Daldinia decipiens]|uniref:uncharacterized protein n=1 Tax=Daldinia decipiens TaxID=326647 RepID=UPI0020C24478